MKVALGSLILTLLVSGLLAAAAVRSQNEIPGIVHWLKVDRCAVVFTFWPSQFGIWISCY